MSAELLLGPAGLTPENLQKIYEIFCQAYEIEITPKDKSFMRNQGLESLNNDLILEYRPYIGAKFFGEQIEDVTIFHGYSEPDDSQQEIKSSKFEELILNQFKKK